MSVFFLLLRNSRARLASAVVFGLLSGLGSTTLLAMLHSAVTDGRSTTGMGALVVFFALCVLISAARLVSQQMIDRTGQSAVFEMRMRLGQKILTTPLRQLEEIGAARLLTVLANDVNTVSNAILFAPLICINAALVLGGLAYLATLSTALFWILLALIVLGGASYQIPLVAGSRRFALARREAENLFEHFRGLVNGTKELKLNHRRERDFLAHFRDSAERQRRLQVSASLIYGATGAWGHLLIFVVVGVLVFLRPFMAEVSQETLVGYTLALLYLMSPIQMLLGTLAQLGQANAALRRIEELGLTLQAPSGAALAAGRSTGETNAVPWQELRLEGITHQYGDGAEKNAFTLGPLSLRFRRGELVFIVGGNGSGKTTLAKVLLGLYVPASGAIYTDGEQVGEETLDAYRQGFSAVFSDFYLFDRFFGHLDPASDERARAYLQRLRLEGVVAVEDGTLSRIDVSRGQQKRLALLQCYLDDRPAYMFDEWAADQDPVFKKFFYLEILPELKRRGKTVLVITHDDQYYEVADRIIKLEEGQVKYDGEPRAHLAMEPGPSWTVSSGQALVARIERQPEAQGLNGSTFRRNPMADALPRTEPEMAGPGGQPVRRPRRWLRRVGLGLALLVVLVLAAAVAAGLFLRASMSASLAQVEGRVPLKGLSAPVTVERDALGVPTVRAANRLDAFRALGFLHAQERFFQMDLLRRQAAGELSELFGLRALDFDKRNRVHRFREVARQVVDRASGEERAVVHAYTDGVNAGLSSLEGSPFEYALLRVDPSPWKPEDSVLVILSMFMELNDPSGRSESDLGLVRDLLPPSMFVFLAPTGTEWDAPLVGQPFPSLPVPGPEDFDLRRQDALPRAAALEHAESETEPVALGGSNNWAVAGSHTADGRAWLADDMHLGIGVPNTWYRASLVRPDGAGGQLRVTGVTLPGVPTVVVGSNGRVAWGFTNSYGDWSDLIELEVDPRQPDLYRTPLGPRRFQRQVERFRVKSSEDATAEVRSTIWGPVIDQDHRGRSRALAWTAHHPEAVNLRVMDLETARDLDEAMAIANRIGVPPQNFVVADAGGRVGWTVLGVAPRRVGFDGRVPMSWADGSRYWDGWLSPEELPRVADPASGRIWTANNRVVDGEMLAKLGNGDYYLGARSRQIRDRLFALPKATPGDLLAIQLDDRALFLERWRKLLLDVLTPRALEADPRRKELRRIVDQGWSGRASIDSAAYRLVRDYRGFLLQAVFEPLTAKCKEADDRFDSRLTRQSEGPLWKIVKERPLHLLNPKFNTWDEQLLAAVDAMLDDYGQSGPDLAERTWGERNTTRIRHPLSRSIPLLGRWLDVPARQLPGDEDMPRVQGPRFGASERLVVSPGAEERGFFHMPVGQSGNPLSPYYRNGHRAWEAGEPTPFLPGPAEYRLEFVPD